VYQTNAIMLGLRGKSLPAMALVALGTVCFKAGEFLIPKSRFLGEMLELLLMFVGLVVCTRW
jgi:hypothetical protein